MTKDDLTFIEQFYPDGSAILAAPVGDYLDEIDPQEFACVKDAVGKRQVEFSTGRYLASKAIGELGLTPQPITRGPDNSPLWQDGVAGSISHTNHDCIVVVMPINVSSGVGIDIEPLDANVDGIADIVMLSKELDAFGHLDRACFDRMLRMHFSAKESIYKAIYAKVGRFVEFHEVSIEIDETTGHFRAEATADDILHRSIAEGTGICVELGNLVFAGFYLPASSD